MPVDNLNADLEEPYPLMRRFYFRLLPVLLLMLVLAVVLIGYVIRYNSDRIYLQRASRTAQSITQDIALKQPDIWGRVLSGERLDTSQLERLTFILADEQKEYRLVGLKVYDLDRRVLYSHIAEQIGEIENSKALANVIAMGKSSVVRHTEADGTTVFELYVPFYEKQRLAAVFELYESSDGEYISALNAMIIPVLSALLILFGFLLLLLVPVISHAQNAISKRTAAIIGMRKRLERLLSRHAVDAMRDENAADKPQGRRREMTVFYSDIRQFTAFCENQSPEEVVARLNQIMDLQVNEVERAGGDVDKFIGDALLARFEGKDRQQRAVMAAQSIQRQLDNAGLPLEIGIGIYSGPVVVGLLGTGGRSDYTIIGDSVNVAARLCTSAQPGEIVCDVATLAGFEDAGFGDVVQLQVKGRSEAVNVKVWKKQ